MQVLISIGENYRFELREGLLAYGDRRRSFVTRHQVMLHKDAPPATLMTDRDEEEEILAEPVEEEEASDGEEFDEAA